LSGIRLSREQHGPKVKATAPPIKNGSSELSGFYHSIFGFLASYRVSNIIKRAGRFEVKTEHFLLVQTMNDKCHFQGFFLIAVHFL
jgi:hypothetical protein